MKTDEIISKERTTELVVLSFIGQDLVYIPFPTIFPVHPLFSTFHLPFYSSDHLGA